MPSTELVLQNDVVFGTVNANRCHYEAAAALVRAGQAWLERLVSRRSGLGAWAEGLQRRPDAVSTVIDFTPVTRSFPPKR